MIFPSPLTSYALFKGEWFLNAFKYCVWFISCKKLPDAGYDWYCKNVNSKLLY